MNLIVFLQNAWSPFYAGGTWPRRAWLRALARSRSGVRLKLLIDDLDLCENTTPKVAPISSGICLAQPEHIKEVISRRVPELIICCGKQAKEAVAPLWHGNLIAVPHPAHRLLTDKLYLRVRSLLSNGGIARCPYPRFEVLQLNGGTTIEPLLCADY